MTFPCMTPLGCPEARLKPGQEGFCPAWFEKDVYGRVMTERNEKGDTRLVTGCFYLVFPTMLVHTTRESGSVAAEVSKLRERTATHISQAVREEVREALRDAIADMAHNGMLPARNGLYIEQEVS